MKNSLEEINSRSRLDIIDEKSSEVEEGQQKFSKLNHSEKNKNKNKGSVI